MLLRHITFLKISSIWINSGLPIMRQQLRFLLISHVIMLIKSFPSENEFVLFHNLYQNIIFAHVSSNTFVLNFHEVISPFFTADWILFFFFKEFLYNVFEIWNYILDKLLVIYGILVGRLVPSVSNISV